MNNQYYTSPRQEMMMFIPKKRRKILEIGCGTGEFSRSIEGVEEAWGVEPMTKPAGQAAGHLFRVIAAKFDDAKANLPKAYFDLVICNDVIEHMPDHDLFLEEIRSFIAPGGVLVGSIPNVRQIQNLYQLLVRKNWNYIEAGVLDRTHLRFFTENSLKASFLEHRYIIESFGGIKSCIEIPRSPKAALVAGAALCISAITLGDHNDIQYLQFGFRVRPAN